MGYLAYLVETTPNLSAATKRRLYFVGYAVAGEIGYIEPAADRGVLERA